MWLRSIFNILTFIINQILSLEFMEQLNRIFTWNYYVVFNGSALTMSIAVVGLAIALLLITHLLICLSKCLNSDG